MKTRINLKPSLAFLGELEHNNNKAWFDSHRDVYEEARQRFEEFVEALIDELGAFENLEGVSARECMFRINRDVRFSKDKSPYKTNLGAAIAPGGKKSTRLPYFIHIAPHDQSLLGGGVHMPTPEQLAKWRQAVDRDASRLRKIINHKDFIRNFGPLSGEHLTGAPKGYSLEHPEIKLLQLKQFGAMHSLTDQEVLAPGFVKEAVKGFKAVKPFLDYLNDVL